MIVNFKDSATICFYPARNLAEAIGVNSVRYFRNLLPKRLERLLDYWASSILDSIHITMDELLAHFGYQQILLIMDGYQTEYSRKTPVGKMIYQNDRGGQIELFVLKPSLKLLPEC